MATAQVTHEEVLQGQAALYTWTLTQANSEGLSITAHEFGDRTVQVSGTFDGATVILQGSNDGSAWFTLTDPQGNGISKSAEAMETVMEVPRYTRANSSGGGASQAVVLSLFCRRTRR